MFNHHLHRGVFLGLLLAATTTFGGAVGGCENPNDPECTPKGSSCGYENWEGEVEPCCDGLECDYEDCGALASDDWTCTDDPLDGLARVACDIFFDEDSVD